MYLSLLASGADWRDPTEKAGDSGMRMLPKGTATAAQTRLPTQAERLSGHDPRGTLLSQSGYFVLALVP